MIAFVTVLLLLCLTAAGAALNWTLLVIDSNPVSLVAGLFCTAMMFYSVALIAWTWGR